MAMNVSIHPRYWAGGKGVKVNTARPCISKARRMKKAQEKLAQRQNAWAAMPENVRDTMRKPGSMKFKQ